jgi:O-antigen/teichoic acid export membrane protein
VGPLGRLRQLWAQLSASLPQGTAGVGGGLMLLGASSYVYLTVSARVLSPPEFAALSVLYTLVYTVGPGLFLPLEQELGRAIAHRRAIGQGGGPVTRKAAALSCGLVAVLLVAGAATWPVSSRRLFDGSSALQAGLLVALLTLWAAHLTRGGLAGLGRFGGYGRQLAVEGLSRAGLCVVLAVAGVHGVGWYGWLLAVGLGLSVLATGRETRAMLDPGPPAGWGELSQALVLLLTGALLSQLLVNAGPIVVKLMADTSQRAEAGRLLAGLVLTRVPLFLFAAVQAALVPNLAAALGRGDRAAFVRGLRRLVVALTALSLVTVVVAAAVGPAAMRLLYGDRYVLTWGVLTGLAAASGMYMLAAVFAQSLVALRRYGFAATAWAVGVATFFLLLLAPGDLVTSVTVAFVGGAAASLLTAVMLLLRGWTTSAAGSEPELLPIATVES